MIVIDPSRFYKENSSLGLNKLFLRAELTHGDGKSEKKEVIGYYEIGESEKDRDVQKAFAFQTFDNMAGAMGNIYFVVRDAIFALFGKGCWDKATGVKTEIDGILEACPVPSEEAKYKEFVDRLDRLYNLLSPESESVLDLLTSGSESLLVNEIANEVLEIDADSMQAILTQMKSDLKSLRDPEKKLEEGAKKIVRERLLRRTILLARDMAEQVREVERLAGLLTGAKSQDNLTKLAADEGCPDAFHISRREFRAASLLVNNNWETAARACYFENAKARFAAKLRKYLISGTINLRNADAKPGESVKLTILTSRPGSKDDGGMKSEFEIRLTSYGWKLAPVDSLLFIKRIGVSEAEEADKTGPKVGLKSVRFAPYPGFTLGALYYNRNLRDCTTKKTEQDPKDQKKDNCAASPLKEFEHMRYFAHETGMGERILHTLAPGFGLNATLMSFRDSSDYDPSKQAFSKTTGANFQLGVGPVVMLFGGKVSATYGWNLMADRKRAYWGLGFSFLEIAKIFKK